MAVFHVPDPDPGGHRFASKAAAGRGELAGICGGIDVFGVCAAGPRTRGVSHAAIPAFAAGMLDGILGAAFGSFLLWGLAAGYKAVRGREGMGMGDVKMIAMIGAFLGLRGTFLTLLVGSLLGSVIGVGLIVALYFGGWRSGVAKRASRRGLGTERQLRWAIARQYQLPLGTFLGIGALAIVYGEPLIAAQWPIFRGIIG